MTRSSTWYTLEEAVSKYNLETAFILKCADEGLIRSKQKDTRSMRVNGDDLQSMQIRPV